MNRKLRIAFIWDWKPSFEQTITWQDGLCAALKELENRGHTVTRYTDTNLVIPHSYGTFYPIDEKEIAKSDVILHWGDMTRPHARPLQKLGLPMAICFAGGEPLGENYPFFDHVFVESLVYKEVFEEAGVSCSVAFGANTELFQPLEQPKLFDTIFPATFASWKRHDLYTHATKDLRSIACGYMYADHEQECWQEPLSNGVMVLPHVSANVLRYLYAASKVCVITSASNGGSQRSVLEAMAMNLPVLVTDSDKFDFAGGYVYRAEPTIESLRGHITAILDGDGDCNTRDYVVNNWSHINYADSLEDALKNLVGHTNLAALAKV